MTGRSTPLTLNLKGPPLIWLDTGSERTMNAPPCLTREVCEDILFTWGEVEWDSQQPALLLIQYTVIFVFDACWWLWFTVEEHTGLKRVEKGGDVWILHDVIETFVSFPSRSLSPHLLFLFVSHTAAIPRLLGPSGVLRWLPEAFRPLTAGQG